MNNHKIVNGLKGEVTYVPYKVKEEEERTAAIDANHAHLLEGVRMNANQLLAETDYLALSDSTLTDEMRTYRQALRDLPANTADPANPVWPTKPEAS